MPSSLLVEMGIVNETRQEALFDVLSMARQWLTGCQCEYLPIFLVHAIDFHYVKQVVLCRYILHMRFSRQPDFAHLLMIVT